MLVLILQRGPGGNVLLQLAGAGEPEVDTESRDGVDGLRELFRVRCPVCNRTLMLACLMMETSTGMSICVRVAVSFLPIHICGELYLSLSYANQGIFVLSVVESWDIQTTIASPGLPAL